MTHFLLDKQEVVYFQAKRCVSMCLFQFPEHDLQLQILVRDYTLTRNALLVYFVERRYNIYVCKDVTQPLEPV